MIKNATIPHLLLALSLFLTPFQANSQSAAEEIFLDAVIASVDGEPITLHEVLDRLPGKPDLSLQEASSNEQVKLALNGIIMEKLIREEASAKRIQASTPEIEGYINEVASRNQLSREEFEKALKAQGQSIDTYREQIEIEILRTKIASTMLKGGIAVTDQEIETYIEEHPEITGTGTRVKLRQILVSTENRSEKEARKIISVLQEKLSSGEPFPEVARRYSESPDRNEGGLLGILAEDDLSSAITDAIDKIEPGQISEAVATPVGFHLFFLEERFGRDGGGEETLEAEVRKILENQKLQAKMQSYFMQEIYSEHAVEKKL